MRGPVVDPQHARAASNAKALRIPGESLLKDALTKVASKEHRISIAMTFVLPAPVESFNAKHIGLALASLLAEVSWSSGCLPCLA